MTRFKIVMRREKWWSKRQIAIAHGDGYFVSENDSTGYSRFVVYKKGQSNTHTFLCNAHNILYVILTQVVDEA